MDLAAGYANGYRHRMRHRVFHGPVFRTLAAAGPATVEAIAVRGERIVATGTLQRLRRDAPPDARFIDLGAGLAVPGFNDDHLHACVMGVFRDHAQLDGLDARQIVDLLRQRHGTTDELILGFGWDYQNVPHPHRRLLDTAFPTTPVMLSQFGGHGLWCNSAALTLLRIDRSTPDPPHGRIERDADGQPSGILVEMMEHRILEHEMRRRLISPADPVRALQSTTRALAAVGVTSAQDNTWVARPVRVMRALYRRGALDVRYRSWRHGRMRLSAGMMRLAGTVPDWIERGPWKYFQDGTFSSRSAWLLEPYADDPENVGKGRSVEATERIVGQLTRQGAQGAFHSIGDRSTRTLIDAIERVAKRQPRVRRLRMRVEHGQIIAPVDIPRLAELGMVVSAQPHAAAFPDKDDRIIGRERRLRSYPYRSLLDAGVPLAFGSDYPGEATFAPLYGMHLAVNREGPEAITAEEALRAYTLGSAYAEGSEADKGSLAVGKLADFAVLDRDVVAVKPTELREINVLRTVVGGRTSYDAAAPDGYIAR